MLQRKREREREHFDSKRVSSLSRIVVYTQHTRLSELSIKGIRKKKIVGRTQYNELTDRPRFSLSVYPLDMTRPHLRVTAGCGSSIIYDAKKFFRRTSCYIPFRVKFYRRKK